MDEYKLPKATVIEDGAGKQKKSSLLHLFSRLNNKFVLSAVIVAGVGIVGYLKLNQALLVRGGCAGKSTSPVYEKAATLMTPQKLNDLKVYTDEISKKKGYINDPNCIYPVLYYHLSVVDVKASKSDYEKLRSAYDPSRKFSTAYSKSARSITDVDQQMEQLSKAADEFDRNRTFSQ